MTATRVPGGYQKSTLGVVVGAASEEAADAL